MIPWTSSRSWQFCGTCGDGGLTICEACKKVVPVLFVEGFVDPVFEGAVLVNGNFRNIHKKETKILDDVILVVEKGAPNATNIVAARSHHLLGWTVGWSPHGLPKEIELTSSNHVADAGDVVEHPPHVLVVKVLFLHTEHRYTKDPSNVPM
jgi:hypothetical protein